MLAPAFFLPLGDGRFQATPSTVGPWDPRLCHGSPPAALLVHALEGALPRAAARLCHLAFDFHGPVAVDALALEVEPVRPGARVDLSRVRLKQGGRTAMELTAWRIAVADGRVPEVRAPFVPPPRPEAEDRALFGDVPAFGYGEAIEWRFAEGAFDALGPAAVWARPRIPLVPGEATSALGRLLLMVDSANGISAVLPPSRFAFVPVALTLGLVRHPAGEWVGMRAVTTLAGDGVGQCRADLFDDSGLVGVAVQTLYAAPHGR